MSIFNFVDNNPLKSSTALESDSAVVNGTDQSVRLALAEMGDALNEATEESANVVGFIGAIGKCVATMNLVAEQQELVADSIKIDGGMSVREAKFLETSLRSLDADFGEGAFHLAALENFGGDAARTTQSEVANEALKDKFSALWARIIEMLEKLKASLKDMWRKLFGSFEGLKKAADAADKKFGSLGTTLEKDKLDLSGLEKVAVDGKVDYTKIPNALAKLEGVIGGLFTQNQSVVNDYADAVSEHLAADVDDAKLKAASAKVAAAIGKLGDVQGGKSIKSGEVTFNAVEVMGGASFMAQVPGAVDVSGDSKARAAALSAALKFVSRKVGPTDPKEKIDGAVKAASPWKQADIIIVGTVAGKIADALLDLQKQVDAQEKAFDDVIKAAKKRSSTAIEEDKKDLTAEVGVATTLANKLTSLSTSSLALAQHVAGVARTALSVADKTAACYK